MEVLTDTMREIAVFVIFVNIISCVIPGDNYKKYLKLVSGIITIIILIKPILKYSDGGDLYNTFLMEYKKSQVAEADKSLSNINKEIADITLADYTREINENIYTFLSEKGFKTDCIDAKLEVEENGTIVVKKLIIKFKNMGYDKNLKDTTTIYIYDIIFEKYNISKEVIEVEY